MFFRTILLMTVIALSTAGAADLVSYRATYQLEPAGGATNGQQLITGFEGTSQIEFRRTCSGWVTNSQSRNTITTATGQTLLSEGRGSLLESLDGLQLRFSRQERLNGNVVENMEGSAQLDAAGAVGRAEFTRPARSQVALPAGTLFPIAHTRAELAHAQRRARVFDAYLFDGSKTEVERLSAVLLSAADPQAVANFDALSAHPSWRITESYFESDTATTPRIEISTRFWANGVVGDAETRMGPLSIRQKLISLEILPDEGC